MKIGESPLKQREFKNHIEEVVHRKIWQVDDIYKAKKEEFVKKNFEKKKKEAENVLKPLIASIKKIEEELLKEAEKIKYRIGTYDLYGTYDDNNKLCLHEIKEYNIKHALEEKYDKDNSEKKTNLKEQIENKKLDIIEKILFADEHELMKLLGELKAIKVDL
mgnify:CR=1 FL=1